VAVGQERKTETILYVSIGAVTAAVLVADLLLPLGVVIWVFYLAPVMLTTLGSRPRLPIAAAAIVSCALGVGVVFGHAGPLPEWVNIANRGFGLVTVWAVALVANQLVATRRRLAVDAWVQQVQTRVLERLQGEIDEERIGDNVLEQLARDLGIQVGALYLRDGASLVRRAGYALGEESGVPDQVQLGEGLVGQVAKEGRALGFGAAPRHQLRIASALVEGAALDVLVAPMIADEAVVAVVEIGKSSPFREADRLLLERLGEPVAVALRSAAYRRRLQELLAETQRQAEALQTQSEELRVTNEELEEQSRALKETHARLELQQADLEESNAQLEEHTQALETQKRELLAAREALAAKALELARANQMKSEFLANMSHELRTPLNSSLILAKLLSDNPRGNLDAEQVRYAQTIYAAGNDLLLLINDILDLSKIEAGRFEVHPETVNLSGLLTLLQRSFEVPAQDKGVALRVEIDASAPRAIHSDGNRIQQVLRNLISNAVKFTEQGEIRIAVRASGADAVAFEVHDTGIGIPEDKQALVFEPFTQADGTTNRKYGGTGLGLSISRQLARLLGGELRVSSRVGEGSTFTLTVPRSIAASAGTFASGASAQPETVSASVPRVAEGGSPGGELLGDAVPGDAVPGGAVPGGAVPGGSGRGGGEGRAGARKAQGDGAPPFPDDRDSGQRGDRLVLIVEDDIPFARVLFDLAHEHDFDCAVATTAAEGIELARRLQPVGVLLDIRLPDASGLTVLESLKRDRETRHIPVHVVSAHDYAEPALHLGALGYMLKPVERDEVAKAFRRIERHLAHDVRRVLVVEDSPELRENLRRLLGDEKVEVETVGTAREALERLDSQTFDCMVLDLMLPDANGFELLERMSAGTRYAFPPVIVYTGRSLSRDEELQLRRYSSSIIVKGARSPERLLDEVSLFLHRVERELPPEQKRLIEAARDREADFEGRKILVVEDDVRNVYALTSILEPRGAEVRIARNGQEALDDLARAPDVDLVLMDTMMPVMDGLTAIREIRKDPKFKGLPIISVTAKAMRDDQELCIQAGANDYLAKPLEVDRLLSLCRVWLPK